MPSLTSTQCTGRRFSEAVHLEQPKLGVLVEEAPYLSLLETEQEFLAFVASPPDMIPRSLGSPTLKPGLPRLPNLHLD